MAFSWKWVIKLITLYKGIFQASGTPMPTLAESAKVGHTWAFGRTGEPTSLVSLEHRW